MNGTSAKCFLNNVEGGPPKFGIWSYYASLVAPRRAALHTHVRLFTDI